MAGTKSSNEMSANVPSSDELPSAEVSRGSTRGDGVTHHHASLVFPLPDIGDGVLFASYDDAFDTTASYDWFVSDISDLQTDSEISPLTQLPTRSSVQPRPLQPEASPLSAGFQSRKAGQGPNASPNPMVDQDSQLLQFTSLSVKHRVVDGDVKPVPVSIVAQLQGSFFLAHSQSDGEAELTFYRRNFFRISGTISPRLKSCGVVDELGNFAAVASVSICLTAAESIEGKRVELIQVSSSKSTVPSISLVAEHSSSPTPVPVRLDLTAGSRSPGEQKAFSFMWKRLQFKSSTANNGRRNGVQQKYRLKLTMKAILASGSEVSLAEAESSAIIVRGRSTGPLMNHPSRESSSLAQVEGSIVAGPNPAPDVRDYVLPTNMKASTNRSLEPRFNNIDPAPQNVTDHARICLRGTPENAALVIDPTVLGLEDGPPDSNDNINNDALYGERDGNPSMHAALALTPTPDLEGPGPAPDPLYEYFPLGLDGWMPPVDGVYRPHIAHSALLVPDLQGGLYENHMLY